MPAHHSRGGVCHAVLCSSAPESTSSSASTTANMADPVVTAAEPSAADQEAVQDGCVAAAVADATTATSSPAIASHPVDDLASPSSSPTRQVEDLFNAKV